MNYEPRDIRQMKLINGEEILAEIAGEDRFEYLIRNPLKVHKERMVVQGIAREANMFTNWMSFADDIEYILKKDRVLIEAIVNDAVAAHYNSMVHNLETDNDVTLHTPQDEEEPDLIVKNTDTDPTYH